MTKGEQMMADLGYVKHMDNPDADEHDLFSFDNAKDYTSIVFSRYYNKDGIGVCSYYNGELTGLYGDEILACAEIVRELRENEKE